MLFRSNLVYTFGRSGDLVCWQLADGKLIWKNNVNDMGGKEPGHGHSSSPLIYEDMVIVQGGGNALVIAFDKINGDVIWKSMIGDAGYAPVTLIQIDDETKLLVYHGKALSCIDLDGNELWRVPWETPHNVNATTPAVENNTIFITSGYGMGGQALEISQDGYKVLWKNNAIAAHHTDPIIIDGYIYGYSGQSGRNNGDFKCVELKTGKEMWSTK